MHIVLIGGAGFIGRALTKRLLHRQATTVTWCQSGEVVARPENVTIVPNLLALSTSDQDAVFGSADFVFYLASTTTPSSGNTFQLTVDGTASGSLSLPDASIFSLMSERIANPSWFRRGAIRLVMSPVPPAKSKKQESGLISDISAATLFQIL